MKILFCDLCNESVPQGDLDLGRAFMRKGRVVCGKCDKLMTQRDELSAALSGGGASAGSGPFGGSPASTGMLRKHHPKNTATTTTNELK